MGLFGTKYNEEQNLVKGCQQGKPAYQEALYNKYYRTMFGVCMRYTSHREVAEDVLQDGFIKVFRKIGSFQMKGSLEGWIRRIMVNTALEHHRRQAAMYPVSEMDAAMETDAGHDLVSLMSEAELLQLIQDLPDGYRTIFNLYAIEGFSHREISEQLSISEGTSKSQLARARQALQKAVCEMSEEHYGKAK